MPYVPSKNGGFEWQDPTTVQPTNPTAPTPAAGYTASPAPTTGQGPYGAVPGQLGVPNPAGDLASVYPNLSGTNAEVSDAILRKLRGELSPETVATIQDTAAAYGLSSGMPGAGIARNRGLRDIGIASEAQQQQGLQDYTAVLPTMKTTQTVTPELQSEIALQNAINASAPDPAAAAANTQALFNEMLSRISGASKAPAENQRRHVAVSGYPIMLGV